MIRQGISPLLLAEKTVDSVNVLTGQLLLTGLLIFFAFIFGRIFRKFNLGESAGQILGGFLCGSALLGAFASMMDNFPLLDGLVGGFDVFTQAHSGALKSATFFLPLYLGVIIFSITDETHVDRMKENWKLSLANFLFQFVCTLVLVFCTLHFFLDLPKSHSVIAAFIASGTSPCTAFITLARKHVEGKFRTVWAQSVTLETLAELAVVVMMFYYFKNTELQENWSVHFIAQSFFVVMIISLLGFWCIKTTVKNSLAGDEISGLKDDSKLQSLLASDTIPTVNIVFVVWSVIAMQVGVAFALKVPFMLPVIITGLMMTNLHSQYVFDSLRIQNLMSFFHLIFFALIGANLDVQLLLNPAVLTLSAVYLSTRAVGKLGGAALACKFFDEKKKLIKVLPVLFLPNLSATAITFMTLHYSVDKDFGSFMDQLVPAFILSEFIASPLITRAVNRWRDIQQKEKSETKRDEDTQKKVHQVSLESLLHDRVVIDMHVRDREDAIKMLCSELMKQGNITELQATIALVLEREKLCSTAVGDEIAIPHCRSADVDYPMAVAAFVQDGESIEWDAPDDAGVRFVFLLVSPLNEPNMHIEAMKTLSTYVQQKDFLEQLYQAAEKEDIIKFLREV